MVECIAKSIVYEHELPLHFAVGDPFFELLPAFGTRNFVVLAILHIPDLMFIFALSFGGAYDIEDLNRPWSETAKHHISQLMAGDDCFIMEHSKEFYQSVIRVIEYIADGNKAVSCEKGEELAGTYWPAVVNLFKEHHSVCVLIGGSIHVTQGQYLNPLYEDCKNHLKRIDEIEYDRNLANEESVCNIKYGRKGYRISIFAIIISSVAILLELAKWIWPRL